MPRKLYDFNSDKTSIVSTTINFKLLILVYSKLRKRHENLISMIWSLFFGYKRFKIGFICQ